MRGGEYATKCNSGARLSTCDKNYTCRVASRYRYFKVTLAKGLNATMKKNPWSQRICVAAIAVALTMLLAPRPVSPAIKNIAVVMSAGTKIDDVQLSELTKLCKGVQKTWIEGKSFTLVMTDPASPDMHAAVQKLFSMTPVDLKAALPKLNETRTIVKIVDDDTDLLRTVGATPGAVGIVDVYAINSTVKVIRIDGKLPFDVGYALKGN
jgi:hypothetical protein